MNTVSDSTFRNPPGPPLSQGRILLFWVPLALTWLMMASEGPFITAIIARLDEPKFNLAAYGVAFSLALIVEAPVIMLMSASLALVKDGPTLRKLFRFTVCLNGFVTTLMVLLIIPPVFSFLAEGVIGLPEEVSRLAYGTTVFLIPWPAAIGIRRFYQGILVGSNLTGRVAYGTVVRLLFMGVSALALCSWTDFPGAWVGALSLSAGVCAEAFAARVMVHGVLRRIGLEKAHGDREPLSYGRIISFYYPLALTSLLLLGAHPIVTFFMGQSRMPIESLAVLPVVHSLMFLFRSFGFSYMEAVIALAGERFQDYLPLRRFAVSLGSAAMAAVLLFILTPAARIWYHHVSGLPSDLTQLALVPTYILFLMPSLEALVSLQRGVLVAGLRTGPVTIATALELMIIVLILFLGIHLLSMIGAFAAAIAFLIGRLVANAYLFAPCSLLLRTYRKPVPLASILFI